ncbi:MAG: DNA primase, partial [uncultured Nocardioides sp.]
GRQDPRGRHRRGAGEGAHRRRRLVLRHLAQGWWRVAQR